MPFLLLEMPLNQLRYRLLTEKYAKIDDEQLREKYLELGGNFNSLDNASQDDYYLIQGELKERERQARLQKEKEMREENKVHDAVTWCTKQYKKQKSNQKKKISKRGIAVEAVKLFYQDLTGKSRLRMIDNLRNSYLKKVKQ